MVDDAVKNGLGPGGRSAKLFQHHRRHASVQCLQVVANCRDIFFPVPFPPSPFGFRRNKMCVAAAWRHFEGFSIA